MVRTLAGQIKEYKADSVKTPIYMILEVLMETMIPLMMASIVDDGVETGNLTHIYKMGVFMIFAAAIGERLTDAW